MATLTQIPSRSPHTLLTLAFVKMAGLFLTVACWFFAGKVQPGHLWTILLIAGAPLLQFPIALLGFRAIDRRPDVERVRWSSLFVHYGEMIVLGVSIFPAIRIAQNEYLHRAHAMFPPMIGQILMLISGVAAALTVLNLAIRGLGLPFAAKLSSRLATDWMYGWTRNPMGLCTFCFLLTLGIRYESLWFLALLVACITPGWIFFVHYFEERELEIRFGPAYLAYRAATPMFWPRSPRQIRKERARGEL